MLRNSEQAARLGSRTWLASLLFVAAATVATPSRGSAAPSSQPSQGAASSSAESQRLARRHLATLAFAAEARTDEALCSAVASAEQTQQSLGLELQYRRDKIFEESPDDSAALNNLEREAREAVTRLPGIGLAVGAEEVHHYIKYKVLAGYAPEGSAAARALQLSGDIWRGPAGQVVAFEPSTDISGCMRPSLLLPALRRLATTWRSVPACLKSQLRPKLQAEVDMVMNFTCYCGNQTQTTMDLKEITLLATVFSQNSTAHASPRPSPADAPAARRYMCH